MKRITKVRILNSSLIALPVILTLSYLWIADDENRFWQGKVIGGAIAIVGVLGFISIAMAVVEYRKTKSLSAAKATFKNFWIALISIDRKKLKKRKKKR